MIQVILDTNFLMIPGQFGVDIFEEIGRICNFEYDLAIPNGSIEELLRLRDRGAGKDSRAAALALQLVERQKIHILPQKVFKGVDDFLVDSSQGGHIIGSNDKELLKRIKGPRIVLRKKQYLQLLR